MYTGTRVHICRLLHIITNTVTQSRYFLCYQPTWVEGGAGPGVGSEHSIPQGTCRYPEYNATLLSCPKVFTSIFALNGHIRVHGGRYMYSVCRVYMCRSLPVVSCSRETVVHCPLLPLATIASTPRLTRRMEVVLAPLPPPPPPPTTPSPHTTSPLHDLGLTDQSNWAVHLPLWLLR